MSAARKTAGTFRYAETPCRTGRRLGYIRTTQMEHLTTNGLKNGT